MTPCFGKEGKMLRQQLLLQGRKVLHEERTWEERKDNSDLQTEEKPCQKRSTMAAKGEGKRLTAGKRRERMQDEIHQKRVFISRTRSRRSSRRSRRIRGNFLKTKRVSLFPEPCSSEAADVWCFFSVFWYIILSCRLSLLLSSILSLLLRLFFAVWKTRNNLFRRCIQREKEESLSHATSLRSIF